MTNNRYWVSRKDKNNINIVYSKANPEVTVEGALVIGREIYHRGEWECVVTDDDFQAIMKVSPEHRQEAIRKVAVFAPEDEKV